MQEQTAERTLRVKGRIIVEVRDAATGALIPEESCVVDNIITNSGLDQIVKLIVQASYSTGFRIGLGTGTNAPAATDTALQTSVFEANVTSQQRSGAVATFKLFLDTTQANGNTLTEVGLFFDGSMVDRALLSQSIVKTSSKTATISVQITVSR